MVRICWGNSPRFFVFGLSAQMPRSVLGLRANAFTANGDDSGHVLYAAWTLLLENVKPGPASWSNQLENWESLVRRGRPRKPRAHYVARARIVETSGCCHS